MKLRRKKTVQDQQRLSSSSSSKSRGQEEKREREKKKEKKRKPFLQFHSSELYINQSLRSKTVVVVVTLLPFDDALHVLKLLHMARDANRTLLTEAVLLLRLLKQLHEQRMIQIHQRHHESLLLLPLPHHDHQKTLWYYVLHLFLPSFLLLFFLPVVAAADVMKPKITT